MCVPVSFRRVWGPRAPSIRVRIEKPILPTLSKGSISSYPSILTGKSRSFSICRGKGASTKGKGSNIRGAPRSHEIGVVTWSILHRHIARSIVWASPPPFFRSARRCDVQVRRVSSSTYARRSVLRRGPSLRLYGTLWPLHASPGNDSMVALV